ncbi:DnaJ family domain-containing protein [Nocardia sp. NPDC052112]|uniref:DnaJ family domain-containing protein n=1 Tax=Nocardia sp. NPDC052112 TaxID=3155646 RepID=UPI0034224C00
MSERKPLGVTFESWIDKQVRVATERGEFENLRGAGKPIPNSVDDENWWLRSYLRREGVRGDGLLPPSLILRRDIEELPETVLGMTSEREVRKTVSELNERIVEWLRMPHGPYVPVGPVNTEEIVTQWRASRAPTRRVDQPKASEPSSQPAPAKSRWWHRVTRRMPD